MNSFLFPVYFVDAGPLSSLLALTRSVWSEDKQRANTDSPEVGKEKVVSEGYSYITQTVIQITHWSFTGEV